MVLVTIIVPIYNVEKYLSECVDSIINQTYKNLQIILVDDGSTDKSGYLCDKYENLDSRVQVVHKNNEGLGFARNTGLRFAQGDYVTFIDSDDKADIDLVERLVNSIVVNNCDTCIGGFKRISENGNIKFVEKYNESIYSGEDVYNKLFARMLGSAPDKHDAIRMSVWNVMYSMAIIRKHRIKFPSERKFISEDIIWDSEYYKFASRVGIIDSIAYNYRVTPGSLTQKYKPNMLKNICVLYNELVKRISNNEVKVIRVQRQFFVNLRACFKQENVKVSGKNKSEIIDSIKTIVNDETVHAVSKSFDKVIKQPRQKIFVRLVMKKRIYIIYILVNLGRL